MIPTDEDKEEMLLSCRYGDLDDVKQFVDAFGAAHIPSLRDENGNTVLHMLAGNGHIDVLDYILPLVSPALISVRNASGSTALHWAALNSHLGVMERLIKVPGGGGSGLIDMKNAAGRSPLAEAEMMGWDEGTSWLAQMMSLEGRSSPSEEQSEEAQIAVDVDQTQDIEVEIEDADGRVARMTLGAS